MSSPDRRRRASIARQGRGSYTAFTETVRAPALDLCPRQRFELATRGSGIRPRTALEHAAGRFLRIAATVDRNLVNRWPAVLALAPSSVCTSTTTMWSIGGWGSRAPSPAAWEHRVTPTLGSGVPCEVGALSTCKPRRRHPPTRTGAVTRPSEIGDGQALRCWAMWPSRRRWAPTANDCRRGLGSPGRPAPMMRADAHVPIGTAHRRRRIDVPMRAAR
jgi:hypothetical protein